MISMTMNGQQLEFAASPDTTLPRLSYAMQAALAWFAGQGMHRVTIQRERGADGACKVTMTSDLQPSDDHYSGVTNLSTLADAKLLPRRIANRDKWDVGPGNATIIHPDGFDASMTVGGIAFGTADIIVFMFRRRVTSVRWQIAQSEMQLWAAPGLHPRELVEMRKIEPDYDARATVSSLPAAE